MYMSLYTLRLLINKISLINFYYIINYLKGARGKKFLLRKQIFEFFTFNTGGGPPMSVHKKFQPNWSSRLAGYTQHIYIYTIVLFYYIDYICIFVLFVYISLCVIHDVFTCIIHVIMMYVYLLTYTIQIYWITHSNIKYILPQ